MTLGDLAVSPGHPWRHHRQKQRTVNSWVVATNLPLSTSSLQMLCSLNSITPSYDQTCIDCTSKFGLGGHHARVVTLIRLSTSTAYLECLPSSHKTHRQQSSMASWLYGLVFVCKPKTSERLDHGLSFIILIPWNHGRLSSSIPSRCHVKTLGL